MFPTHNCNGRPGVGQRWALHGYVGASDALLQAIPAPLLVPERTQGSEQLKAPNQKWPLSLAVREVEKAPNASWRQRNWVSFI
mmetsp:Transcript_30643/g.49308  ORF Transcript_30643/g.49308 Transcript_30643/m.49308 type:complete len:83 (-) Transcript_30643:579-827(-)